MLFSNRTRDVIIAQSGGMIDDSEKLHVLCYVGEVLVNEWNVK